MRSAPESGSAARPASCSTGFWPSRLPENRKSMEHTKVLTAVGRRVSPARLALNPALRLFRDSVRLKANTSARFSWEEGFFAAEASLVDESIFVGKDSFEEEAAFEEEVFLMEEVSLDEKESSAGEEFLMGEASIKEE